MKILVCLSLVLAFTFCVGANAQDNSTIPEHIIGKTFKLAAKAFVAASNLDRLKASNVARLTNMSDEHFDTRYQESYYGFVKDFPPRLKARYHISSLMTKDQAIAIVKDLDKSSIYELIDAISDKAITGRFFRYLHAQKKAANNDRLDQQVQDFSNSTFKKLSN